MRPQRVSLKLSPRSLPVSVDNSDSVGLTATRWRPQSFRKQQTRILINCNTLPGSIQAAVPEEGTYGADLDADDSVIQELAELLRVSESHGTFTQAEPRLAHKSHPPSRSIIPNSPTGTVHRRLRKVISNQVSPALSPGSSRSTTRFLYLRSAHPGELPPTSHPLESAYRPWYKR